MMAESEVAGKNPIVFSKNYDITFGGLEKCHVFDSRKWGKVISHLTDLSEAEKDDFHGNILQITNIYEPSEATEEDLLLGHTKKYLDSLKSSCNVAKIVEVPFVAFIPNYLVNRFLLKNFRYHVAGTIMATDLALKHKWAINVGGGFHHASNEHGGGFCVYADISIAIRRLQKKFSDYKFLIIDLDAHQGNGHETDFTGDASVFIFDMFNEGIYPFDTDAKKGIKLKVGLMSHTKDAEYLERLRECLDKCFEEFSPNLIIYNAGTDCLIGDPLGRLNITEDGIIKRDEMVFRKAMDKKCPITMVTSGGYQMSNALIIAKSIWNLFQTEVISYA